MSIAPPPLADYAVLATRSRIGYKLRIRELFLSVQSADLQQAYDELMQKKARTLAWAHANGAIDELPQPAPVVQTRLGRVLAICRELMSF